MAQGNVEVWLGALLKMAMQSVHAVIKQAAIAIDDPNFDLMEFLRTYPAQVNQMLLSMPHITMLLLGWSAGDSDVMDERC